VLVVDETGDLKKGTATVGVQRQYTGTAGKIDNAQVAVYLTYATTAGHGVIDRELYLPQGWLADAERCWAAGVPTPRAFATKPELAKMMLQRALDAGVPAGWVTADEVDGGSPALRGWLEGRQLPYVLAVKCTEPLPPPCGPPTPAARLAQLRPFWDRPLLTVSDRQMPMLRARRGHGRRGRHSLQRCSNGHQLHWRVGQSWTTRPRGQPSEGGAPGQSSVRVTVISRR
jgi:SRSO17 transposase